MISHPELDGPFSVPSAWTISTDEDGNSIQIPTTFQDNRWNTTLRFYNANLTALEGYRTAPNALVRVWSGDDPTAPQWTIPLAFPDANTAQIVLISCGAIDDSGVV